MSHITGGALCAHAHFKTWNSLLIEITHDSSTLPLIGLTSYRSLVTLTHTHTLSYYWPVTDNDRVLEPESRIWNNLNLSSIAGAE